MDYTFYILQSKNPEITECYIGSTKHLTRRIQKHKSDCTRITSKNYNFKVYIFIRLNGGFDEFEFIIIDVIKFTKTDALIHEQKLMHLYGSTLNSYKAHIPEEDRIEKIKEYHKEYYLNNKKKIKESSKEYRLNNKEQLKEYNKKYRLKNKK